MVPRKNVLGAIAARRKAFGHECVQPGGACRSRAQALTDQELQGRIDEVAREIERR